MEVQSVEITGMGESDPIVVNCNVNPVSVGFGLVLSGQVDCSFQICFDDERLGFNNWFDYWYGLCQSEWCKIDFPVSAVRVKVNSGSGSVRLNLIQAG